MFDNTTTADLKTIIRSARQLRQINPDHTVADHIATAGWDELVNNRGINPFALVLEIER